VFKLYIVNGYFLKKYRDFYKQYRKLMAEGTVPYSSFSRAIKSVLPVEPNVEEIALIRYSKKVHTTFNVNPKKIKGPVATTVSIEPNVEEIALIRYSKKVHTTFNVNPKKIKGPVATTMSIAVLRAMARDMPEFKKVYEADLQEMKRELAEEEEEPKKEEEDKEEVAKGNVQ